MELRIDSFEDSGVVPDGLALHTLDVHKTEVAIACTGQDVRDAIDGHVLAEASLSGTHTFNPRLRV